MKTKLKQQGDVLFFRESELPEGLKEKEIGDKIVFAEGEATGHAHTTTIDNVKIYEDNVNQLWTELFEQKIVTHEEHKPITLNPGIYRIGIVQEVDPFNEEINKIAD